MTAFDLQCHSSYSDGVLAPADVMAHARQDGMELVALTDHDTVDGVEEARAAATELGMRFSPAAEISAVEGRHADLHVCGYEIDVSNPELVAALDAYRHDRQARVEAIADRLEELGFTVDRSVLVARKAAGLPIGRPHIADAVLEHPENRERLEREGRTDKNSFFPEYLVPGGRAFVQRTVPDGLRRDRRHPRRGRRRDLGAPVLGPRRRAGVRRDDPPLRRRGA